MKYIFLDIDGVLNNSRTKNAGEDLIAIDDGNVRNLKRIIKKTCAEIVLVSSWKECWDKENKDNQGDIADEIDEKLSHFGLSVYDKTEGGVFFGRGKGVLDYVSAHDAESFVIIDDSASDYIEKGLSDRWVRTDGENGGLTSDLADKAIRILNGDI